MQIMMPESCPGGPIAKGLAGQNKDRRSFDGDWDALDGFIADVLNVKGRMHLGASR